MAIKQQLLLATCAVCLLASPLSAQPATADAPPANTTADADREMVVINLAANNLKVTAPKDWRQVKPRNRLIEVELAVAASEETEPTDLPPARLTIMSAGGSVDANLTRWKAQFKNATDATKVDKAKVGEMPLTVLDISGTYLDSRRGPFGPKEEKPNYQMIAGILETKDVGNYFFKLVGPTSIVKPNAKAFRQMLDSVERTKAAQAAAVQKEKAEEEAKAKP